MTDHPCPETKGLPKPRNLFGFSIPPNEGPQARICREDKGSIGINERELEAIFADFLGFIGRKGVKRVRRKEF
jgi:hypothetical protein